MYACVRASVCVSLSLTFMWCVCGCVCAGVGGGGGWVGVRVCREEVLVLISMYSAVSLTLVRDYRYIKIIYYHILRH